ncbi:MAG: hypothetical protein R3C56_38040 [Pirellulaceae bacterium]
MFADSRDIDDWQTCGALSMTIWSEGSQSGPKNQPLLQADSLHSLPRTETTLAKHHSELAA